MNEFPGNSKRIQEGPKVEKAPEKKIERVVNGPVIRRKKPLSKRLAESFIGTDDTGSIPGYIFHSLVVPATKDLIADAVSQTIERILFGEASSRRLSRGSRIGGVNYTNYRNYSSGGVMSRQDPRIDERRPRPELSREARAQFRFDEIILDSRHAAQDVIDSMYDILSQFNVVSVADLYRLIGERPEHTDFKWGWLELPSVKPIPIRNGYLLDIPQPQVISD